MATNKEIIQVKVKGARKSQKALKGIGSAALKMGAVFFAAKGVINGVKGAINAFGEQEMAMKKIETVLKSTNNASGITAQGYADMASELQSLTTFGDEAIMGAQSLMMTFTKVGQDVMPKAIETTLNMAEAMGVGLKEQTIQLGKALNDPILGISALSRVGVQLSEQQKASIKDFMAVGDAASAQGVILGELETQFGGMARGAKDTMEGSIKSMKNSLGDLGEVAGGLLAPAIEAGANLITGIAAQAEKGINFAKTIDWEATFKNMQDNTEVLWDAWISVARVTMDILPDLLGDAIPKMMNYLFDFIKWTVDAVIGIAKDLWKPIGNAFETLVFDIGAGWDKFRMLTGQMFETFGNNVQNKFIGIARAVIGEINYMAELSNEKLGTSFGTITLPELIDTDKIAEEQTAAYDKLIEGQETARQKMIDAQEGSEIIDFLSSMFLGESDEDDLDTWQQYTDALTEIYGEAAAKIIVTNTKIDESNNKSSNNQQENNKKIGKSWEKVTDKQRKSLGQAADQMVSDLKTMADANDKYTALYKAAAIARTIASTYESAQTQFEKFSKQYPAPTGSILGYIAAAAAVGAGLVKVDQIRKAQYGADFITSGPQMMMVGDNAGGREHVSVTPLGTPNLDGPQGQGVTLNISGNVLHESFIEDDVIPQIREGLRLGENMGI